jgi:hypothetical protein
MRILKQRSPQHHEIDLSAPHQSLRLGWLTDIPTGRGRNFDAYPDARRMSYHFRVLRQAGLLWTRTERTAHRDALRSTNGSPVF